jgi:hypothetical protein
MPALELCLVEILFVLERSVLAFDHADDFSAVLGIIRRIIVFDFGGIALADRHDFCIISACLSIL